MGREWERRAKNKKKAWMFEGQHGSARTSWFQCSMCVERENIDDAHSQPQTRKCGDNHGRRVESGKACLDGVIQRERSQTHMSSERDGERQWKLGGSGWYKPNSHRSIFTN